MIRLGSNNFIKENLTIFSNYLQVNEIQTGLLSSKKISVNLKMLHNFF